MKKEDIDTNFDRVWKYLTSHITMMNFSKTEVREIARQMYKQGWLDGRIHEVDKIMCEGVVNKK